MTFKVGTLRADESSANGFLYHNANSQLAYLLDYALNSIIKLRDISNF